jgi:diguanylate cyclase (GGDEF)-like protein/PAS domain S-box-containing protein
MTDNTLLTPPPPGQAGRSNGDNSRIPNIRSPFLLLICLIVIITGGGYFVFQKLQRNETRNIEQNLAAIANLKADQINSWIEQNTKNAEVVSKGSLLADRMGNWLKQGAPSGREEQWLRNRLEFIRQHYSYRELALLELNGKPRLSTDTDLPDVSDMQALLQEARNQKQPVLGQMRWDARHVGAPYVSLPLAAPLIASDESGSVVGTLWVELDVGRFLFPLLQSWPTPSKTAETMVVRREDNQVIFLNELRNQKDTALRLRIPSDEPTRLAAQAARGTTGFISGSDYRGKAVIGYALKVPGTDWFMVAQMDADEVYAPIRQMALAVTVTALVILLISSLLLYSWWLQRNAQWQRRNAQYRAAQLQSELKQQFLAQQYEYLRKYANDIILLCDKDLKIIEANDRVEEAYGLTRAQLIGKNLDDINSRIEKEVFDQRWKQLMEMKSLMFESTHVRNDGTEFPVEVSARVIEKGNELFVQSIVRDITERKKAEEERLRALQQLEAILENITDGVIILDVDSNMITMNRAAQHISGFHGEEQAMRRLDELEQEFSLFDSNDQPISPSEWPLTRVQRGETFIDQEIRADNKVTGISKIITYSGVPIKNNSGAIYLGVMTLRDVTGRKQAEEELKLAATVYQDSSEAMMVTDAKNRIISVNASFETATGYKPDEIKGKNAVVLRSGKENRMHYREMLRKLDSNHYWQGELWLRKKNGENFAAAMTINSTLRADGSVNHHVVLFSDVTQKKEADERIWQEANFDALTGLPNRRMFQDHLQRELRKAARSSQPLALMFMDLDGFKDVNDMLGHDMGDLLLKETAQRLLGCVRDTDTVARLGGDEFTIILSDLRDSGNVEYVARHILEKMTEPFKLGKDVAHISASIGITLYPQDATGMDELLINADQAMYAAKQAGKNRYSYFTDSIQQAAQERMWLVSELRNALAGKQFSLVYQPIVDLSSGCINKAEALIRWRHPERGLIDPSVFIPVAEETGMIQEIGDWVFSEAASQAVKWRKTHHPDFQISINKSPVQFKAKESDLASWLNQLNKLNLPGQSIAVEITEEILMNDRKGAAEQLLALRDAGIEVSLDDFGTGYSSLSYLKRFDIDRLKIDRTFVRDLETDPNDLALCEAIIVMAHKLNIKVIAEGVETKAQRDLLQNAGCDFAQGYFFSDALSAQDLDEMLGRCCH